MHAYLFIGGSDTDKDVGIAKLGQKLNANLVTFPMAKIADVRELNTFLRYSPPKKTLLALKNIDSATTEALNAFLKHLEEPPGNVFFALTAQNEFRVLPTISSRCRIMRVTGIDQTLPEGGYDLMSMPASRTFEVIGKIRKRDEAILFVKDILFLLHIKLTSNNPEYGETRKAVNSAQKTLDALTQNGNVTIQLLNMIVNLE